MDNLNLDNALKALRTGQVIAHATDTCYGFACDHASAQALARLYGLKDMPFTKPVSILVADFSMAQQFGEFSEVATELAKKYWPGAVTLIVRRKKTLPDFLNPGIDSVGIRVPDHALSRELVEAFGKPITTTSANISGLPSPYSVTEIHAQFEGKKLQPDFILDSGELDPKNLPSTIVDCTKETPVVIRQGSVAMSFS